MCDLPCLLDFNACEHVCVCARESSPLTTYKNARLLNGGANGAGTAGQDTSGPLSERLLDGVRVRNVVRDCLIKHARQLLALVCLFLVAILGFRFWVVKVWVEQAGWFGWTVGLVRT